MAGIISTLLAGGGFWFLKARAEKLAKETATSIAKSLLDAKMVEINCLLREKTAEMEKIKTNLNDHIHTYDAFNKGMKTFKDEITTDLEAFLIVIPKTLELAVWIRSARTPDTS